MQPKTSCGTPRYDLGDHQPGTKQPMRYGWSEFGHAHGSNLALALDQRMALAPQPFSHCTEGVLKARAPVASRSTDFALPMDQTVTISVIAGPSKGLTHRFTNPLISLGCNGGGADIELDDPTVSGMHCAIGVKRDRIRLCDLDSTTGTYINDERVQAAELEHLSEFRVGSSLLLVTILPKREMGMNP